MKEIPPWTTTSVKVSPAEHPRLVVGTDKFPEVVVHTQLLQGNQSTIFLTNPHACLPCRGTSPRTCCCGVTRALDR